MEYNGIIAVSPFIAFRRVPRDGVGFRAIGDPFRPKRQFPKKRWHRK